MATNERRLSDAVNAEDVPLVRKYKDNVDDKPVYERSSTWFRWVVLFFSCWAMFGSCYDCFYIVMTEEKLAKPKYNPTALQNKLMPKYHLSNIEYNLLYSVYSFPNMVLPLFGGVFVDRFGAGKCLIVFLGFCVLGQMLFALASSLGWYWLMLVGTFYYYLFIYQFFFFIAFNAMTILNFVMIHKTSNNQHLKKKKKMSILLNIWIIHYNILIL
ncbi:hypothetical protein RFI_15809 [Reticulomyxa filosa]|uniref:Major facilitator superfamily (MFS) profile domain-containing protein n=1 Tax=Reticulomyxa filosa TaxID=46433 RepID=X6N7X8_RETFI|nr:hypothetical protein RFI_15809 [Reticulomyxa filosa]|eukprot:ETO21387.1 hypothetical protein RFI_15809 [Reticulomyxa filosa]